MQNFSQLRKLAGLTVREAAEQLGFNERTIYRWERGNTIPRKAAIELLLRLAHTGVRELKQRSFDYPAPPTFKFIDLFAGIGGMRRGFSAAGGRCVFTSEWDKFSQQTYIANYPMDHPIEGDITKIEADQIPKHDVLLAGFPCQPFSLAGVSKKNSLKRPHGFECDTQGTLFFDVARIIDHHKPKAFVLENVRNLTSHDRGRTFEVIMRTLEKDLGYKVQTRIIDASAFVPQHRERIFIVGFREKNEFNLSDLKLPSPGKKMNLGTILHPEDGTEAPEGRYTEGPKGKVTERYTLSDHLWQYLQAYAEKHRLKGNGFGYGLFGSNDIARTLSARYHKDGAEILIRQKRKNPRRLTPRECARLMGFDKPGESQFVIPVSDTQAYRQLGNAVVVPVIETIARHMEPWLGKRTTQILPQHRAKRAA